MQPKLGAKIRRLRRESKMTQADLAQKLGVSASYLNLIEHNRRNVTVALLLRLSEIFKLDFQDLAEDEESQLVADLMEAFGDDFFEDSEITTTDVRELVTSAPMAAKGVLALYDAYKNTKDDARSMADKLSKEAEALLEFESRLPAEQVSDYIQANQNHFPDIEDEAARVWRDAELRRGDLQNGLLDYLKTEFGVRTAVLPPGPGGGTVRKYDATRHTLELSDGLPPSSRLFQIAHQVGLLSAAPVFDMLLNEGGLKTGEARSLGRVALANYFASAVLMPYDDYLKTAKSLRYDVELLQHHFGVSFEQACHRLTTMQRPGDKGVPFHMLRVDIAGNISKRVSISGLRIPRYGGACPRWNVYTSFLSPGVISAQVSRMPDGDTYFCIARTIHKHTGGYGEPKSFLAIGLGCEITYAPELVYADGIDLENPDRATPAGVQCRTCSRTDCRQRAFPPLYQRLNIDENVRGLSAYVSSPSE